MKRFLFDSNVYDEFLENQALLDLVLDAQSKGLIELIGTHVELDELQVTRLNKPSKGIRLVSTHLELNPNPVATEGFVLDVSRLDMAKPFDDEDVELFNSLTANNPKHSEDVLMIMTAKNQKAIFVSQETKRIPRICRDIGLECFTVESFQEWCLHNLDEYF